MPVRLHSHHRKPKVRHTANEIEGKLKTDDSVDKMLLFAASLLIDPVSLLLEAAESASHKAFTPIQDCTGGAFIIGMDHPVAVFKPIEQEPYTCGNSKGYCGQSELFPFGIKTGVLPGEGAIRDLAAWMLDYGHFASVPTTVMTDLGTFGLGSLQRYVQHDGFAEDFGPSTFPPFEIQKVALLDIRIANLDRHAGNLLVSKANDQCKLTPIDHALSLPQWDRLDDICLEWLSWPQAREPLENVTQQYVDSLDGHTDFHVLLRLGIRPECAVTVRITTMLLQIGLKAGLSLRDIGVAMVRPGPREPSQLESLVEAAVRLSGTGPLGPAAHSCAACGSSIEFFVELVKAIVLWARSVRVMTSNMPGRMSNSSSLRSLTPVHDTVVY
jgi:hypothetical protein